MESKKILKKVILLFISIVLFVLSNPNFIFQDGLGFLAFFYFIPVFILVRFCSLKTSLIYGGCYGAISYSLYAYWLFTFDPVCLIALIIVYFILFAILFSLLKICDILFPKNGWILQWLCICSFEYLKTKGFLGFSYGVTVYTQWKNLNLIQITKIIGPFGLSAFILFLSGVGSSFILKYFDKKNYLNQKHYSSVSKSIESNIQNHVKNEKILENYSLKSTEILMAIWSLCFLLILIYGNLSRKNVPLWESKKVVAIQSNESPWKNGIEAQIQDIAKLMSLTDEALELNPDIEIIVWPETAVVPAIVYQWETQKDQRKSELIKTLLEYINSKDAVFVIGNGHEVNSLKPINDIYNSALVFVPKENVIPPEPKVYAKNKLVPFTETFPYQKTFPEIYRKLRKKNHMWTAGKDLPVFYKDKLFFSTPICFEDTFPDISRKMVNKGSRCLINLSNDSWSNSIVCQNQHLAMAVFRSVENKVPTVRSTTSGQTCIINPYGEITAICSPFSSSYTVGFVPVIPQYEKNTIYNRIGDIFALIPIFVFFILLLIRGLFVIIKKSY